MTSTSIITMFRVGPANNRTNETRKMEVEKSMVSKGGPRCRTDKENETEVEFYSAVISEICRKINETGDYVKYFYIKNIL